MFADLARDIASNPAQPSRLADRGHRTSGRNSFFVWAFSAEGRGTCCFLVSMDVKGRPRNNLKGKIAHNKALARTVPDYEIMQTHKRTGGPVSGKKSLRERFRHWSRASFPASPMLVFFRDGSNTRSTWRFQRPYDTNAREHRLARSFYDQQESLHRCLPLIGIVFCLGAVW